MKRNKSIAILLYLSFAFFILIFFMSMIGDVLGYWVNGGENILLLIKNNLVKYAKVASSGILVGVIFWLFDIR
ncbi:hypothetical protein ID850_16435 [Xenorhabdus sp. Flor]|uniref:hypothetical protein n=1 Tax=Xenorhabdus TaxID=626 RepID=UPI0019837555|nr:MULTISPECIES: hypothetical protein [unclassified Xenorhabdus]MBD2812585.1 hypothetical protein [Xenorhabdus sp. Vera]MBD2816290.1 hypothetical protein [Xenorhabdus sp. Flor]